MKNRIYFPNLNGIRAIGCLFVFLAHAFAYLNFREIKNPIEAFAYNQFLSGAGPMGVSLFFVLSGFLISYLLLSEKKETKSINLKTFYARRVLRIWPMFFLVVIACFFVLPFFSGGISYLGIKGHLPSYVLFINNFDRIKSGFTGFGNDSLGVLWSVAIEEQFYIIWPLLLLLLPKKLIFPLLLLIISSSALFRFSFRNNSEILLYHTFSVMGDLATGAIVAYLTIFSSVFRNIFQQPKILFSISIIITVFLAIYFHNFLLSSGNTAAYGRLLMSLAFGIFIAWQVNTTANGWSLSKINFLGKFGTITYGFYCLHMFVIMAIQKANLSFAIPHSSLTFYVELIITFIITTFISLVSYRYFEGFFLRKKMKFEQ